MESTGYALLTYLQRNLLMQSMPIMKWLNTMRNNFGGMASTQDSVVALKALTEYAKLDTNRALYNMEVLVLATSMGSARFNQIAMEYLYCRQLFHPGEAKPHKLANTATRQNSPCLGVS